MQEIRRNIVWKGTINAERQKLPNPQVDTQLPLPDRVIYYIHYNRKYIQESDTIW